ncbi:hypothetical protein BDA99DRAFT_589208 [Phascolomyces articulosus]|uniref:Uncharacterized protein n=1 Tax=Phascolomyces articulosus TaxID=60185 RepID=A0AAD5JRZ5_9FUNG|nr:hypothetical protein BDA99DRAFT_589208 [Phascolomyces articulosus]
MASRHHSYGQSSTKRSRKDAVGKLESTSTRKFKVPSPCFNNPISGSVTGASAITSSNSNINDTNNNFYCNISPIYTATIHQEKKQCQGKGVILMVKAVLTLGHQRVVKVLKENADDMNFIIWIAMLEVTKKDSLTFATKHFFDFSIDYIMSTYYLEPTLTARITEKFFLDLVIYNSNIDSTINYDEFMYIGAKSEK